MKTVIITGGSRGIGAAAVRAFCARGDRVAFLYEKEDEKAQAIAAETGAQAVRCDVAVLGGGVSKAGSFLLDAVRARVPKYLLFKTLPYSRIELARLGADAGMIGAAMLGRQA